MQIGARTTGGLVSVRVTTGGSSYSEPPDVVIGGNATATAHLRNGRVSGVVIGSQGSGYTASPTVSLVPKSTGVTISSFTAGTDSGTVTFAATVASTWARVQSGTQSATISSFSNATQAIVGTTSFASSGQATLYSSGTGAAATAFAYTGSLRPISFFKGRFSDVYGVDGMGRGLRWNGVDASVEKLGIASPAVGPAVTASSSAASAYVASIQMVQGGGGYHSPPTVTITGGGAAINATGRAIISNGRVTRVIVTNRGSGYKGTPTIGFSGGIGTGAAFNVGVSGAVANVLVTASGVGYTTSAPVTANTTTSVFTCTRHGLLAGSTFSFSSLTGGTGLATGVDYYAVTVGGNTFTAATTIGGATNIFSSNLTGVITIPPPRVEFATAQGLTDALATLSIDQGGRIAGAQLSYAGTGATTTGVTASVVGGAGTNAKVSVDMTYSVASVTVATSGSGYYTAPVLTFRAATSDPTGSGAAATVYSNATGNLTGVSMVAGGVYSKPPTAIILDTQAKAQATIAQPFQGKYQCAIRYLDDTPETARGPIPSSISELVEVDVTSPAESLTWTLAHYGLEDRVHAVELWRSSTDQSVSLFRIATIYRTDPAFTGTYADKLSDLDLIDTKRDGFAAMPIVLPSGQLNARRFGVPPGEFAVATMFQDRAWYAVDTSGTRPNSLMYSEVDEPESVPEENELVLQENTLEPDKIVGLFPLGGQLLVAQSSHLYALSYVSQPIIDASMLLMSHRGALNHFCGDVFSGVAVLADSFGMYAFDGNNTEAISVPVDNYWRDNIIDFTKSSQFHVRADAATMTARFFYCQSGDSAPVRALCYCMATKAWWEETYASPITASCRTILAQKTTVLYGGSSGGFLKNGGLTDSGTAISYKFRTGNMALTNERGDRSVALVYQPTDASSPVNVGLHFNNSTSPRPNAIATNTGTGFVTLTGSTVATLDMDKARSPLGDANGYAQAHFSGRVDDRSAGGDKHIAIDLSGQQSADDVTFFGARVAGAE